jgi:RNA recognition motif-containing protein
MAKRIYVGGLSYSASEQDLQELFSRAGEVSSIAIITDRYSGQSKGFAFVEMASDVEAQTAINSLNGTMLDGRSLTVNEAKPREERSGNGSRGGNW